MATFLFDEIIFGPVHSRRLGLSLGINLLPADKKYCNFNCIYCECGFSNLHKVTIADLPARRSIREALVSRLKEMRTKGLAPDVITYAGNGEPTMHPDFPGIIDDSIAIRDEYSPETKIAVLTNSMLIHKKGIAAALCKVDQPILKLDTVNPATFKMLNCPVPGTGIETLIRSLIHFPGKKIIQTLFIRGTINGHTVDNTSNEELNGLIDVYRRIGPEYVMIYTFIRDTPVAGLVKIPAYELEEIGKKIERADIKVTITRE